MHFLWTLPSTLISMSSTLPVTLLILKYDVLPTAEEANDCPLTMIRSGSVKMGAVKGEPYRRDNFHFFHLLSLPSFGTRDLPGTASLLKVIVIKWSMASNGTKLTAKRALPCGWTLVGIFRPRALMVISKLPSPAWLASTKSHIIDTLKSNMPHQFSTLNITCELKIFTKHSSRHLAHVNILGVVNFADEGCPRNGHTVVVDTDGVRPNFSWAELSRKCVTRSTRYFDGQICRWPCFRKITNRLLIFRALQTSQSIVLMTQCNENDANS